jgi:CheY-like chemotaxis protein
MMKQRTLLTEELLKNLESQIILKSLIMAKLLDYLCCNMKKTGTQFPKPMLILMDIMPVMDGWEFLEAYRKLDSDKKK